MKTIYLTRSELNRINAIVGPPPDPVTGNRAESRRYKRAIIKAVRQVCSREMADAIRNVQQVRVEVVADPNIYAEQVSAAIDRSTYKPEIVGKPVDQQVFIDEND